MDVQNLQNKYPQLIAYLESASYSKFYISGLERDIKRILREAKLKGWKTYTDAYLAYVANSNSLSYLRGKRTAIGAIEQFEIRGLYPDRRRRNQILRISSYDHLPREFKSVIDFYRDSEKTKKDTTIYTESHNATTFLLSLHKKGINSLSKITEGAVLEIFFQNGKLRRSCSYKKNVSAVLKTCIPFFPKNTCARILTYMPNLYEKRENIQYLTQQEVSKLKAALTDSKSTIVLRDKAIGLLALYTGLRSCDIAALTMADIDWEGEMIHIRQQKTDVPLEIPLRATVGNAIYDYMKLERPGSEHPEIFVLSRPPYARLQSKSLSNVAGKIMKIAGIRTKSGDRKGFHIFRHHVATALLGNNISPVVISRILGHASPASLNAYLSADLIHLKGCALSIACFPLGKEVCFE
ncbi:tyrosine-type recombinase/integrase [Pedobacter psychrodurus]|uniref:tyrosine-type recombinase/integrase n=1 Tax=Pedobacter psychrodurus TaxID=2530456 RepID=UPI00293190E0|nr:tyrosine-type recombinase/integrase [Pedobacter psychrodurus]